MSNPGVVTLAETNTSLGAFRVEDNIGEAIHFHLGDIRYDLSVKELNVFSEGIEGALDEYLDIPGFHSKNFSKEFLFQIADKLDDIKEIKEDVVFLEDLEIDTLGKFGQLKFGKIYESRVVKALKGDPSENNKRKERNFFLQTNSTRLVAMLNSIKKYGYPYNDNKIVLFNSSNHVWDGQHRAGCLYYLYGNIEVPVIRIIFREDLYNASYHPYRDKLFKWNKTRIKKGLKKIKGLLIRVRKKLYLEIDSLHYKYDKIFRKDWMKNE